MCHIFSPRYVLWYFTDVQHAKIYSENISATDISGILASIFLLTYQYILIHKKGVSLNNKEWLFSSCVCCTTLLLPCLMCASVVRMFFFFLEFRPYFKLPFQHIYNLYYSRHPHFNCPSRHLKTTTPSAHVG